MGRKTKRKRITRDPVMYMDKVGNEYVIYNSRGKRIGAYWSESAAKSAAVDYIRMSCNTLPRSYLNSHRERLATFESVMREDRERDS